MKAEDMKPNAYGLVPVEMLVSEAGLGIRAGEIRGVSPDVAENMINRKTAKLVAHPASERPAKATAPAGA